MAAGDRLFYFPTKDVYGGPETYGLSYESVNVDSEGESLHGWFFPAMGEAIGTLVHFHGNAGNISGHFEQVRWLPASHWNVFCFDYRGYGQSTGQTTRSGTIADGRAAIKYVKSRSDVDSNRLVVFGQSLGGAVAIVVTAQQDGICGLAVEGAFSSYRTEALFVGKQNLLLAPVAGLVTRILISPGDDPIDWVGRIAPTPILFICGINDRIVDYRQTVALHEAAGKPKSLWIIEGGGHTDSMREQPGRDRLDQFFRSCVEQMSISGSRISEDVGHRSG